MGLEGDVAGLALGEGEVEGCLQALRGDVRGGDLADLAFVDEGVQGADDVGDRDGLVVEVGVEQVDAVGAEAAQGGFGGGPDGGGRQPFVLRVGAQLGGGDHVVAPAALGEPAADQGLRFAARVALHPRAVRVGGVDEVAAALGEGVQDVERVGLVGGPAEDVPAQAERGDGQTAEGTSTGFHGRDRNPGWLVGPRVFLVAPPEPECLLFPSGRVRWRRRAGAARGAGRWCRRRPGGPPDAGAGRWSCRWSRRCRSHRR